MCFFFFSLRQPRQLGGRRAGPYVHSSIAIYSHRASAPSHTQIARGHVLRPMKDTHGGAMAAMRRRHPAPPIAPARRISASPISALVIGPPTGHTAQCILFDHLCCPLRSHSRVGSEFQSGPSLQLIHIQNPSRLPHIFISCVCVCVPIIF